MANTTNQQEITTLQALHQHLTQQGTKNTLDTNHTTPHIQIKNYNNDYTHITIRNHTLTITHTNHFNHYLGQTTHIDLNHPNSIQQLLDTIKAIKYR